MALAQTHYSLRNVRLKLKTGVVINATEVTVKRNPIWEKKHPGEKIVPSQVWMGEDIPEITGTAYFDADFNWSTLANNTAVAQFDLNAAADGTTESLLPAEFFAKFPPSSMTITLEQLALNDKLTTIPFTIHCNVLNPGVNGGFPGYPTT